MILKNVVEKSNFEDVYKFLIKYDEKVKSVDLNRIRKGYEDIKSLSGEDNKDGFTIVIRIVEDAEEEYYDVSGVKREEDVLYSLVFTEWEGWLGFEVDEQLIKTMDFSEITAHCFWEMTWHGWTKKEREYNLAIQEKEEKIGNKIEENIKNSKVENKLISEEMLDELIREYKRAETDRLKTDIEIAIEELIKSRLIQEQQIKKIVDNFNDEDILKAIKSYAI